MARNSNSATEIGRKLNLSAAQLQSLDDLSTVELGFIDGITAGTAAASKALVLDASSNIATINSLTSTSIVGTNATIPNVDVGFSGQAGTLDVFPGTASKGKVAITATDNTGDTTTSITVGAQAAARTYTLQDAGYNADIATRGLATVTLTAAQVIALNSAGIEVLAAPGAGLAYIIKSLYITKAAGTAYAGVASGDDLTLNYTNAAGDVAVTAEMTGFADSTSATQVYAPGETCFPVANAAIVADMTGDGITTGDSDFVLRVEYEIVTAA